MRSVFETASIAVADFNGIEKAGFAELVAKFQEKGIPTSIVGYERYPTSYIQFRGGTNHDFYISVIKQFAKDGIYYDLNLHLHAPQNFSNLKDLLITCRNHIETLQPARIIDFSSFRKG